MALTPWLAWLEGAFSVIVKTDWKTDAALILTEAPRPPAAAERSFSFNTTAELLLHNSVG